MSLPERQRAVLNLVRRYFLATGEACPASYIARKLDLHHSTVQEHLNVLYHKGLLLTPNAPARPR